VNTAQRLLHRLSSASLRPLQSCHVPEAAFPPPTQPLEVALLAAHGGTDEDDFYFSAVGDDAGCRKPLAARRPWRPPTSAGPSGDLRAAEPAGESAPPSLTRSGRRAPPTRIV